MRENRTSGTVQGAPGNRRSYCETGRSLKKSQGQISVFADEKSVIGKMCLSVLGPSHDGSLLFGISTAFLAETMMRLRPVNEIVIDYRE